MRKLGRGAKLTKFDEARIGGMQYVIRLIEEKGLQYAKDDVEFRCKYKIPVGLSQEELDQYSRNVKDQMFDTMKVVASMALRDEFGFGGKRLKDFWVKFEELCEARMKDYVSFQDFADTINEECKVDIGKIRVNKENVKVRV